LQENALFAVVQSPPFPHGMLAHGSTAASESQVLPLYPVVHRQLKSPGATIPSELVESVQVASFWHGFGAHSSMSSLHVSLSKPAAHSQVKESSAFVQTPPLMHGSDRQASGVSVLESHVDPCQPSAHVQANLPAALFSHVASFWHGTASQPFFSVSQLSPVNPSVQVHV
jgi:hypothetical protein